MSLQLPAILSPPTPCIPSPALTVSPLVEVAEVALPFTGRRPVLGFAFPTQARQCIGPYRVQHCFVYGLAVRLRLPPTPSLDDAVTFGCMSRRFFFAASAIALLRVRSCVPTILQRRIAQERVPTILRRRIAQERVPTILQRRIAQERVPTILRRRIAQERVPTILQRRIAQERVPTILQ